MQVSWINPEDVASLAESLRTPPPSTAPPPESLALLQPEDVAAMNEAFASFGFEGPPPEAAPPGPTPAVESQSPGAAAEERVEIAAPAPAPPDRAEPTPAVPGGSALPPAPAFAPAAGPSSTPEALSEGGPDLSALRQRLQEIRERAVDAGLLPPPVATAPLPLPSEAPPPIPIVEEPATPADAPPLSACPPATKPLPFEVPLGSVMARLEAFAAWARASLGTEDLFVVDDEGDLLWGPQDQACLILSSLLALNAAARANARSACEGTRALRQTLPSGLAMTVIPCHTRLGLMQVAVVGAKSPGEDEALRVRDALTATMDAHDPQAA